MIALWKLIAGLDWRAVLLAGALVALAYFAGHWVGDVQARADIEADQNEATLTIIGKQNEIRTRSFDDQQLFDCLRAGCF